MDNNNPAFGAEPQQTPYAAPQQPAPAQKSFIDKVKSNPIYIAIAGGALLLFIILFIFPGVFRGGSATAKGAAKAYAKAYSSCNAKKLVKTLPPKLLKYELKKEDMSKKEFIEMIQLSLDFQKGFLDGKKLKYKIVDSEKIDKDGIKNLNDELKEEGIHIKVTKAYKYKIEYSVDGKEFGTYYVTVGKVGGRWYCIDS